MVRDILTGTRIRERRIQLGLRQAELARKAHVSASYLNLIEHNKRRIGGKLLLDLSTILEVDPSALTDGADSGLLEALRMGAARFPESGAVPDDADTLAGRHPQWARLIGLLLDRQDSLEQTVAALTDRMTHDPQLAASLHDIVGAVTGIRASSSILAGPGDIEPEWQKRFARNINEDAARLAESARGLVVYLGPDAALEAGEGAPGPDAQGDLAPTLEQPQTPVAQPARSMLTPQEELDEFLAAAGHRFPQLEQGAAAALRARASEAEALSQMEAVIDSLMTDAQSVLVSASARAQARRILQRYAHDARSLSLPRLAQMLPDWGLDPAILAAQAKVPLDLVLRRLVALPPEAVEPYLEAPAPEGLGVVICDSSGTFTYRKPVSGFAPPRYGAACPLWPLYQALSRPLTPVHMHVAFGGRDEAAFECFAWAGLEEQTQFGQVPLATATMLLCPGRVRRPAGIGGGRLTGHKLGAEQALELGQGCRTCTRTGCRARREPSILTTAL